MVVQPYEDAPVLRSLSSLWRENLRPRTVAYIKKDLKRISSVQKHPATPTGDYCWVEVNEIMFLNIYKAPHDPTAVRPPLSWTHTSRSVAICDFNSVYWVWQPSARNCYGQEKEVEKWAEEHILTCLIVREPTHRAGNTLDLVWTNIEEVTAWVGSEECMTSDHLLICGFVPNPKRPLLASVTSRSLLRVLKTNLPHFARVVSQWLPPIGSCGSLDTIEEIENFAEGINWALENALKAVGKRANKKVGRGAPWWTSECKPAHLNYRKVTEENERSEQAWIFRTTVGTARREDWNGNEEADAEARATLRDLADRQTQPNLITLAHLRRLMQQRRQELVEKWWSDVCPIRYQDLDQKIRRKKQPELALTRQLLHKLLAARTGHGDFAAYHRRLNYLDANLECVCEQETTPTHFIRCRRYANQMRKLRKGMTMENFRRQLLGHNCFKKFVEFAKITGCFSEYKSTSKKKTQIKKAKNIGWRATVSEATQDSAKIWKLANQWHQISVDIRDIDGTKYPDDLLSVSKIITQTEVEETLRKLPNDKAPGPDGIPNRVLKCYESSLSKVLAELFNAYLTLGYHPKRFKGSTTIVLKKSQKPRYDTPKVYRLIALLYTMGKRLEKLVANRISKAAEDFNLLPDEQMGARPKRFIISAVELLSEQIHTIWGKDKKKVASLLSLGISGVFDNISHKRIVHNLREKGIPRRICAFVKSFLVERTTSIVLGSFKGEQMPNSTGIPQGSSLSQNLFLFFVNTLFPLLQTISTAAVGFVDDTNILTWLSSTEENWRKLEEEHGFSEEWARKHGVRALKPLRSVQRKCLKQITGAYKSTSSRVLEHETSVLPIELFLKQRRVQNAGLSDKLSIRKTIISACNRIKLSARGRGEIHAKKRSNDVAKWNQICGREENVNQKKVAVKIASRNRNILGCARSTLDTRYQRTLRGGKQQI
ncbi:hypothetical protein EPUL_003411 [Erysiphe pulchra]|uniref:Reverse transcriptase domain-containing protein n=1 Tax=Erysiphe pulchra TaxID=225359 RepID=A0A2S4PSS3_9PEZI|nr:hypothetical protein EPUL_003411 [Erysiphe pulchra]